MAKFDGLSDEQLRERLEEYRVEVEEREEVALQYLDFKRQFDEMETILRERVAKKTRAQVKTKKAVKQPPRPMTQNYGVKGMVYPEGHPYAGRPVLYAGRGVVREPLKAWMKSPEGMAWRDDKNNTTMLPLLDGIKVKGEDNAWTPEQRKAFWEKVLAARVGRPLRTA